MRSRSDTFDAALAQGGQLFARATLTGTDGQSLDVPIGDGSSVQLEDDAASRASLTLNVPINDSELIPDEPSDYFAPYGSEILVERGITTAAGTTESVTLGVFRIDETHVADSESGLTLEVSALDRSARVIEAVFEDSGQIAAGTNALDAAMQAVADGYPEAVFDFPATDVKLPLISYEAGDDRWDVARGCAEAAQCNLYFDGDGVCVAVPFPIALEPILYVSEGEDGILLSADKTWSRENACNRVVVYAENNSEDPDIGEAIDLDPASPTYYDGPFGRATFTYSTPYIRDESASGGLSAKDKANSVAQNILNLRRGVSKQISFSAIVNPALEPWDTIRITRERLKINEDHIVSGLTIPLDGSEMSGTTRLARAF